MTKKNLLDFNRVYKGIYIVRLVLFLVIYLLGIVILAWLTNESIINYLIASAILISWIVVCGWIGNYLKLEPYGILGLRRKT